MKKDKPQLCKYFAVVGKCKFGNMCKFSHEGIKCWMMRHAQSYFNEALEKCKFDASSQQAKQEYQLKSQFMDCGLTQKGCEQIDAVDTSSIQGGDKVKFDIIFVSPLERCLKSTQRFIVKHKIRYKKVLVLPGLTQVLSKICDFSHSIQYKKKKYELFDFSLMEAQVKQDSEWQDILVDPEHRNQIEENKTFGNRYMQLLKNIFPQPLQNSARCFDRVQRTLTQIKRICQEQKAIKVLIISHNRIIKYIMGRHHGGKHKSILNCEIKFTLL